MVQRYTPKTDWQNGDDADAAWPNKIEGGIESLDQGLDAAELRLDAVQAQLVTLTDGRVPTGTTAERPPPVAGQQFFDKTLNKPIWGDGTAWRDAMGVLLTGSGSSNAPTGMTAVVQPDNSIVLTWNSVAGAERYKLYEIRSPSGVSGADNLLTTTSTRTPSTMGNYEYWVTAFVGGVESAQSNHAVCSLPYGSIPGDPPPTSAGSPADLLALGGAGGKWNLGVGYPSGHVDIAPATLEAGWSEAPYFRLNDAGTHVYFQVPMNGGKTSTKTKYPRVELREYIGGSKAAWSGSSGTHVMSGKTTMLHMEDSKPESVIAQMHDGSDDTLQIRYNSRTELRASINGSLHPTVLGNFPWGTEVAWEIRLVNGQLTIRINGATKITTNPGYGSGQYFKVGVYAQQNVDNGNPANGYQSLLLRDLAVSHS